MFAFVYFVVCTLLYIAILGIIKREDGYVDIEGALMAVISYIPIMNLYVCWTLLEHFVGGLFEDKYKFLKKKLF